MATVERVRKAIPGGTARMLWVKSGGRCQYSGCNISLWKDSLTQRNMNKAYISHIIAAKPNGPRGDKKLSKKLEIEYSNLLLLCDECHNRIDEAQASEHTVETLRDMKRNHEARIELLTGIKAEKRSHLIFYGAKIGSHDVPLNFNEAALAMLPERFPCTDRAFEIGIKNSSFEDSTAEFWRYNDQELINTFKRLIYPLKGSDPIQHFSVFALAPQPLLIRLGTLLGDLYPADIYQRHREPATWKWEEKISKQKFTLTKPANPNLTPVLIFSLSTKISVERLPSAIKKNCAVWEITMDSPHNDFLKSTALLENFRVVCRQAFSQIRAHHNKGSIHLFPAMPISAAIETGRVWMPKADLTLIIYDQNPKAGTFSKAIEIK